MRKHKKVVQLTIYRSEKAKEKIKTNPVLVYYKFNLINQLAINREKHIFY